MLITTIEELRFHNPSHAYDSIDGLVGFIDNSEHDFLEEKLGTPLYERLCQYYRENHTTITTVVDENTEPWNELLLMAQRVVAFDALGRSVGMQVISPNNSGINVATADGYERPKKDDYDTYRNTCYQEAHSALNHLLRRLEQWCKATDSSSSSSDAAAHTSSPEDQKAEIAALWRQSSYYYLAATLLIPSCVVMQRYLNIYDSREKFIQLLPDLQFIQEEQIEPAVGNDLINALINYTANGVLPAVPEGKESAGASLAQLFSFVAHRLRKVMAALLVGRTSVLKYDKAQKVQAHDDGVRMLDTAITYLRNHQADFPEDLVKNAPWYVAPEPAAPESSPKDNAPCPSCCDAVATENESALWTPPLL